MPEPDCFLRYRIGYGTLQHCLGCQQAALLRGILCRENPTYTYCQPAARARHGFKMVLFTEPSKTFVGGICAIPSALLVFVIYFAVRTLISIVWLDFGQNGRKYPHRWRMFFTFFDDGA